MSALSDIIANLESGGGAYAGSQPSSMVNPTYGQYAGFVSQYGDGAAGVDNYASQVLAANPNATLGDLYSGYVLNTGNPASTPGLSALQSAYPSAYNNLVNNAGVSADTPLSSLLNGGSSTGSILTSEPDLAAELAAEGGTYDEAAAADPSLLQGYLGSVGGVPITSGSSLLSLFGIGGSGNLVGASAAQQGSAAASAGAGTPLDLSITGGLATGIGDWVKSLGQSIVQGFDSSVAAALGPVSSWVTRGFLILIGVVLVLGAIWLMASGDARKTLHAVAA